MVTNTGPVPNSEGGRTTPSVVAYTKGKELLVGAIAKRQAVVNPCHATVVGSGNVSLPYRELRWGNAGDNLRVQFIIFFGVVSIRGLSSFSSPCFSPCHSPRSP